MAVGVGIAVAVGVAATAGVSVAVATAGAVGVMVAVSVTVAVGATVCVPPKAGKRGSVAGMAMRALVTVSESTGVEGVRFVALGASFCSCGGWIGFSRNAGPRLSLLKRSLNVPTLANVNAPTIKAIKITMP